MTELVVATTNPGKLREIQEALDLPGLAIVSLAEFPGAPEVIEDGETFLDNALKKALAIAQYTGKPALADDSGLCVDALGGAPGVFSARYAGEGATDESNNQKLLAALAGVPRERRTARFVCVIAVAVPDGAAIFSEGTAEGLVLEEPRGEGGFGYDPLFHSPELGAGFGEVTGGDKLKVSHRGRALRELSLKLADWLSERAGGVVAGR